MTHIYHSMIEGYTSEADGATLTRRLSTGASLQHQPNTPTHHHQEQQHLQQLSPGRVHETGRTGAHALNDAAVALALQSLAAAVQVSSTLAFTNITLVYSSTLNWMIFETTCYSLCMLLSRSMPNLHFTINTQMDDFKETRVDTTVYMC